jgi:DNA repair photolyase
MDDRPVTVYIHSMSSKTYHAAAPGDARPAPVDAAAALKGRGTAWAVAHRFQSEQREPDDDGWGLLDQQVAEERLPAATQVFEERVKNILSTVDSPDIGFDLSINPYRGCEHGCIYCYARPTHSYLNLSPGLDFETRIVAKVNAAERLRAALMAPGFTPKALNIGSVTDAYQPAERRLRITRSLIEVLRDFQHPFSVITKSAGIIRDLDLIAPMAEQRLAMAFVSITTLDPQLARILEPRAASPQRRLDTIARLAEAGVPVGVSVSPLIPFINEPELESVLEAAQAAGARSAFAIVIRLPWEVNPLFQHWLETHFPDRAARVMARIRDMRGGADNSSRFGERMRGTGPWADLVRQRLHLACARLGLSRQRLELDLGRFRRPGLPQVGAGEAPAQGSLF